MNKKATELRKKRGWPFKKRLKGMAFGFRQGKRGKFLGLSLEHFRTKKREGEAIVFKEKRGFVSFVKEVGRELAKSQGEKKRSGKENTERKREEGWFHFLFI